MTPLKLILLSPSWHPRKLWVGSELGTVQNPSNVPYIYQESTGLTPGAVGSVAGLVLDDRYLARGGEIWADASAALTGEATRLSANVYRVLSSAGALSAVSISSSLTIGKAYEVTFTVDSVAVAGGGITVDSGAGSAAFTTTGAKRTIIVASGTSATIKRTSSACDIQISNVSFKEVPGNHALQATAGSRPTLNAGKINFSAGAKSLVTTWASSLGTSCTVAYSVPQGEAVILTGQTITTTHTMSTDHCGLVIINRDLTATETNQLRRWLNRRAG
jgi:hypothetical protein